MPEHGQDAERPDETPDEDRLAEAYRLIAERENERMLACAAEIEQVLAKHGMRLEVPTPQISIVPSP